MKKKGLKRLCSAFLALNLFAVGIVGYAKESEDTGLQPVDQEFGIYRLNTSGLRAASQEQDTLIQENGQFYIHLQDDLYAEAERKEFYAGDSLEELRPEMREVVSDIFRSCENSTDESLVDGKVEVYIPCHEEQLCESPALAARAYPVTNEQA